jgi:hypothetical protein
LHVFFGESEPKTGARAEVLARNIFKVPFEIQSMEDTSGGGAEVADAVVD